MTNDPLDPPADDASAQALTGEPAEASQTAGRALAPNTGESTAEFELFYRAETTDLVRFLVWLGAPLADAADVAQDTMIEAFRRWSTIRTPRAWVRRVATRTFLRQLARVDRPVTAANLDGRPLLPAGSDLAAWEQHHEIRRLLGELPPRQRQVMAWTFDGYQPTEIAAELGITPDAVRATLKLARLALAQHLPSERGPR